MDANAPSSHLLQPLREVTEVRLLHPYECTLPTCCNPSGKVTEVRLLHPENAIPPAATPPEGHRGEATAPKNAHSPTCCNPSGKVTERLLHHGMHIPHLLQPLRGVTEVRLLHPMRMQSIGTFLLQPLREGHRGEAAAPIGYGTCCNPSGKSHRGEAPAPRMHSLPTCCNPSGRVTQVRWNASAPTCCNPSGRVTEVRLLHSWNAFPTLQPQAR